MTGPSDTVIQATNEDATYSKVHAIRRGYWKDQYIRIFCPLSTPKSPEISRGYFIRTQTFKAIAASFIKDLNGQCQVVNFGAGSDTLYFQLRDENLTPLKFVEVDLSQNVRRKAHMIRKKNLLGNIIEKTDTQLPSEGDSPEKPDSPTGPVTLLDRLKSRTNLITDVYSLIAFDLRRPVEQLISLLSGPDSAIGLDTSIPTLFLAECVLVYMPPQNSSQLIKGLSAYFPRAVFLHYEQVNMDDQFGKVMIDNFRARDCDLPGLAFCQSLEKQEMRFKEADWKIAKAWSVNDAYKAFSKDTRLRVEHVEMLDDAEIAKQLFDHYCFVIASTDSSLVPWFPNLEEPLSVIS